MWDYGAFTGFTIVILLTGISAIILVVIIGRWTNRQLRPWMSELLAPEVASGLITDDELTAMVGSPRDRRHYVHAAKKEHGKAAGKATRHVLDAELDLAEALGQSDGTESDDVDHARVELQRLRLDLDATLAAA
jgi:VIT1/CCC1 family predicted Fe2+/Mn2+ transporter